MSVARVKPGIWARSTARPAAVERIIRKLAGRYKKLHFCYEAGPTGYGLYRQVRALGDDCTVVASSLIPKKPGERVKTNRCDAVTMATIIPSWSDGSSFTGTLSFAPPYSNDCGTIGAGVLGARFL
jgi:transposase